MQYYFVLIVTTTIIIFLARKLWTRTRSLSFPAGIALIYFWTLYGAWFLVAGKLSDRTGLRYSYLEYRLFPIRLDSTYFWTLVIYGGFIIVMEGSLLHFLRTRTIHRAAPPLTFDISHLKLQAISATAIYLSLRIIGDGISLAERLDLPAYAVITNELLYDSPYYSIHQILGGLGTLLAFCGFAIYCSGPRGRLFVGPKSRLILLFYALLLGYIYYLSVLLGNKHDLFIAAIAASLLFLANSQRRSHLPLALAAGLMIVALGAIDILRGIPEADLANALNEQTMSGIPQILTSNEMIAAHFSLYGALYYDVPQTSGASILSLIASFVPRLLWPGRPASVYEHYADSVGALPGQGYTIHHATAWLINFGLFGVAVGAILLAWVWAALYLRYESICIRIPASRTLRIPVFLFSTVVPWVFVGELPGLIRAGFEGYKSVIVDALGIILLIWLSKRIRLQRSSMQHAVEDRSRPATGGRALLAS